MIQKPQYLQMPCRSDETYNPFSVSCQTIACSDIDSRDWLGSCDKTSATIGRLACAPLHGSAMSWQCDIPLENYECPEGLTKCRWDFDAANGNEHGCKGKEAGTKCSRHYENKTLIGYCAADECCVGDPESKSFDPDSCIL